MSTNGTSLSFTFLWWNPGEVVRLDLVGGLLVSGTMYDVTIGANVFQNGDFSALHK